MNRPIMLSTAAARQIGYACAMVAWLLGLLVLGPPSVAQQIAPPERLLFQHFGEAQGLPESRVESVCQDREGFMWFGTTVDGLYKYDGHSATAFVANPADPAHSLRANGVAEIHEDRQGRLWVATFGGGLHRVDKRKGNVIPYPIDLEHDSRWDELMSICEDAQGILWLGTGLGIARFDPATGKYTLYPTPNGEYINNLQADATGKLWSGSYCLDPETGRFALYPLPVSFENKLVAPYGFHIDAAGIAWLGTWEDGLFRMDTRNPSRYTSYNPQGWVKKSIIDIIETDGHLWLGTLEGLQRVDTKTGQVLTYQLDPSQPGSLSSNHITSVYHDRSGNLWIGTSNGINKASIQAKPFHTYQIVPTPPAFQRHENLIFSVLEDRYGTLWLSSAAKGLYRMDTSTHQLTRVVVNPADKRTTLLSQGWPLLEDAQGRLWVGTDMEKGLYQLDRSTNTFIRHPCRIFVRMLDHDATGRLWVGGWRNEIASFDPLTKRFTYYQSDEKDSTSLLPGFVYDLMVSRSGEVWVATFRGLSRLNPKTGKFTRYHPNSHFTSGQLSDHLVQSLYEDEEGMIWVGTFEGGLNRLDPTTNTFTSFTTRHGLPSNRVTSIMGDQRGNLWLGTRYGLCRFNPNTNTFRNFDMSDGLLGNEFLDQGSVYRRNGKLFFGSINGLVVFNPDSIKEDRSTFPVYITGVKVLETNRPVPGDTLTLTHTENFFSLAFAALNYTSPQKNRYAYQLEGVDKDWVYAGQQRVARYTELGPGKYTFRVKATIDERAWNKQEARLTIIIHPPWWRTYWAYGFYFLCLLAGVFAVDRFQRRRLISREREKARERELAQAREIEKANQELAVQKEELESTLEHLKATQTQLVEQEKAALENKHKLERAAYQNKMAELEMQALRAQMNPHFIFNCLNSINRFILKNQSEAASDYLTKFSRLIRLILLNSQSQAVPLENELEALKLYLQMEELRFEGRFHFLINPHAELEIEDLEVPPLIIQPYVENAIWHGLMHKEGQGHLSIDLHRENDTLLCQITDDGVGRKRAAELKSKSASKGKSLGMQITSHRLALINSLHEKETTVQIVDLVDPAGEACGTRVVLKIPV